MKSHLPIRRGPIIVKFAKRTKRRHHPVLRPRPRLNSTLGARPHKKHIALPHLLPLRPDGNRARTRRTNDNTRPVDRLEGRFRRRPSQVCLDDGEFLDRRIVQQTAALGLEGDGVEFDKGIVGRVQFLVGDRRVGVREHGAQRGDVFEFRREAGADDVVRRGHALDDVAG